MVQYLVKLVFGYDWNDSSLLWGLGLGLWLFFYYWYCWGKAGKTPAAALLGIQVVRHDAGHLGFGRAWLRPRVVPVLRPRVVPVLAISSSIAFSFHATRASAIGSIY